MSILKKLEDKNIVAFDLNTDNKTMEVMEYCDYYYKTNLDKGEVHELIQELILMHDRMA